MQCLDENLTTDFVLGSLAIDLALNVEAHVLACEPCCRLVQASRLVLSQAASLVDIPPSALDRRAALAPDSTVGRYRIEGLIGTGGMGAVYAAFDPALERRVAIKVLSHEWKYGDHRRQERLVREARILARLTHPNICAVHDVGTHEGRFYIALEHIQGRTLSRWLSESPRSTPEILQVFAAAGHALSAAHASGIVHRDFKPDNVLVSWNGRVVVMDFGLARAADEGPVEGDETPTHSGTQMESRLTQGGARMGTPAYMAPEQARGEGADARSDQFSFAVALVEALWGERPVFTTDAPSMPASFSRRDTRTRRTIARASEAAIFQALRQEPSARHRDIAALLDALAESSKQQGFKRWSIALVVASAVLVALVAFFVFRARYEPQRAIDRQPAQWNQTDRPLTIWPPEVRATTPITLGNFNGPDRALPGAFWASVPNIPVTKEDSNILATSAAAPTIGIFTAHERKSGPADEEIVALSYVAEYELEHQDPLIDGRCTFARIGSVVIILNQDASHFQRCEITVRPNDAVVMTLNGSACLTIPGQHSMEGVEFGTSAAELSRCAIAWESLVPLVELNVTVDEKDLPVQLGPNLMSPLFGLELPKNNKHSAAAGRYWGVGYGRLLVFRPLPVGTHEIRKFQRYSIGSGARSEFTIHVVPGSPAGPSVVQSHTPPGGDPRVREVQ